MNLQSIQSKIYEIRDLKVMLDFDLAKMYEVNTSTLKRTVRRNIERFPEDFMFQLTREEWELVPNWHNLPERFSPSTPFAFTEQGVAMLSGVLNSAKAVQMNIVIMRTFVLIRRFSLSHKELTQKLQELELKYDKQFNDIFDALNYLIKKDQQQISQNDRKKIGFKDR